MYENNAIAFFSGVDIIRTATQLLTMQVATGLLCLSDHVHIGGLGNAIANRLIEAEAAFDAMGARASRDAVRRVKDTLTEDKNVTVRDAQNLVSRLVEVYYDELSSWHVLFLNEREVTIYENGEAVLFGEEVVNAFPSARTDIAEACKCFALGRWTATTYHCMGVVERGIKAVCKELNAQLDLNSYDTTWDKMRKAVEAELIPFKDVNNSNQTSAARRKRSHPDTWDEDEAFFWGLIDDMKAIQRAYRNTSMHFRVIFDSDQKQAKRVLDSTVGFMQDLAMRVREIP